MAYTIQDQPVDYSPSGTPLIYVVYSDNFTESKFKYTCQLYNSDNEFMGELKGVPQPSSGWGKFDVSRLVNSSLDTTLDIDGGIFSNSKSKDSFTVQLGEEYIDGTGSFVRTTGSLSDTKTYFNGTPYWNEFLELRDTNTRYIRSGSVDTYPLTARRKIESVRETKQWLYYITDDYNLISQLQIEDLDTNEIVEVNLPAGIQTNDLGESVAYRTDSKWLEDNTLLTDLKRYRVRTLDNLDNPTSNWINYEILDCTKWDLYSLYYVNRWGGVDSFSFHGESEIEIQTERKQYKNNSTPIGDTGQVQYSNSTHTNRDYSVKQSDIIKLNSDWVSYSQYVSAVDLQASQRVWMEDKDGIIVPVNIDGSSFEIRQPNNRVMSVSMNVRYTQPIKRR